MKKRMRGAVVTVLAALVVAVGCMSKPSGPLPGVTFDHLAPISLNVTAVETRSVYKPLSYRRPTWIIAFPFPARGDEAVGQPSPEIRGLERHGPVRDPEGLGDRGAPDHGQRDCWIP